MAAILLEEVGGPFYRYGALGVGVGVGVDALITRRRVIYERPATRAGKVSVSPLLGDKRQRVLVTMDF